MSNRNKDIDKLFRDEFRDFNPEPPDHVWESVFNQLEDNFPMKRRPSWMKIAASIAALIVPSIIMLWLFPFTTYEVAEQTFEFTPVPEQEEIFESVADNISVNTKNTSSLSFNNIKSANNNDLAASNTNNEVEANPLEEILSTDMNDKTELAYLPVNNLEFSKVFEDVPPVINTETGKQNHTELISLVSDKDLESNKQYISSLGAAISPQYSSNYFPNRPSKETEIPFESLEESMKTYSFSMKYSLQGPGRFGIETGVNYYSIGQVVKDIIAFGVKEELLNADFNTKSLPAQSAITSLGDINFNNSSFYFADMISHRIATEKDGQFNDPQLLGQYDDKISQYLKFIDIPLIFNYTFLEYYNVNASLRLGASGSFLLSNNVYVGEGDFGPVIGETSSINKFAMAGIGGLSINIPVTNKLNLNFEPTARMFFMPVTNNNYSGKIYPLNLFLSTGFSYSF